MYQERITEKIQAPQEPLTRHSLFKITEDNDGWHLVCRYCTESFRIPIPFVPSDQINQKGKRITVKTKEKYMQNILEWHYGKHMQQINNKKEKY